MAERFEGRGPLSAAMFIWASGYLGIVILLLSGVPLALLSDAFAAVPAFRDLTVKLSLLCAAYAAFGVLVLRYRATPVQRLVVSVGPGLLAFALTIGGLTSRPSIPRELEELKNEMIASGLANTVCTWYLGFVAYRFVSKKKNSMRPNWAVDPTRHAFGAPFHRTLRMLSAAHLVR
jgi:hypothetical protein